MIERRPLARLGGDRLDWLDTRHHFSFAGYRDPERMGWGALRVWNDDEIAPGTGFPPHPHADMEIITYVRDGAISHEDSLGNKGRTEAGDVLEYAPQPGRHVYLVPATGALDVNGVTIEARDGAAIRDEKLLRLAAL